MHGDMELSKKQIDSIAFTLVQNEDDISEFVVKSAEAYNEFLRICQTEAVDITADTEMKYRHSKKDYE